MNLHKADSDALCSRGTSPLCLPSERAGVEQESWAGKLQRGMVAVLEIGMGDGVAALAVSGVRLG